MWIKTKNGWAPLYTMSAPKLETPMWVQPTAKLSDFNVLGEYTGELTSFYAARDRFVQEQQQLLEEVRQQRIDRGLL